MWKKLQAVLAAPFKWGYEAVDTRPSGSTYRRMTSEVTAVAGTAEGEIALVVGHGKVEKMPVVGVLSAADPVEAVNATLKFVNGVRRSQARSIHVQSRAIDKAIAQQKKAEEKAAEAVASGNVSPASPGQTIPSNAAPGSALGEPILAGVGA